MRSGRAQITMTTTMGGIERERGRKVCVPGQTKPVGTTSALARIRRRVSAIEISAVKGGSHDAPTRAASFVRDARSEEWINCTIYLVLARDRLEDNDSIVHLTAAHGKSLYTVVQWKRGLLAFVVGSGGIQGERRWEAFGISNWTVSWVTRQFWNLYLW